MSTKPIIFNLYPPPRERLDATLVYANDPVIQLDQVEAAAFQRHPIQQEVLKHTQIEGDDSVLGSVVEWACCGYIVQRLSKEQDGNQSTATQFGTMPVQPMDVGERHPEINDLTVKPHVDKVSKPHMLYLFNMLVALEWIPDQYYMQQLAWAFRRASDFLCDVTDGHMAFGQVVFGGPELMYCADIQIMASNRLYPRSWVKGLLDEGKYTPIRLGRAMWHRRNHVDIPWDEPEGYRTIIHEWAHYALGLRDAYLEVDKQHGLVVPRSRLPSTSIMASLEGTSELVAHTAGDGRARKSAEWDDMRQLYPGLPQRAPMLEGPGRLPLPLPYMRYTTELKQTQNLQDTQQRKPALLHKLPRELPPDIQYDHCWVYVLHGIDPDTLNERITQDTLDARSDSTGFRLIAQGTLDARWKEDGFALLGAGDGDTVILINDPLDKQPTIFRGTIENGEVGRWAPATLNELPLIDVVPYLPNDQAVVQRQPEVSQHPIQLGTGYISVRIKSHQQRLPKQVWVFPLGQSNREQAIQLKKMNSADAERLGVSDGEWISEIERVRTLDGHVLALWENQVVISPFSQGGGPPSHGTVTANPITAGSSDGNILIFFHDPNWRAPITRSNASHNKAMHNTDYSDIKITTTLIHDEANQAQHADLHHSYTYSLASTKILPQELTPTMVMYYDPLTMQALGDPYIEHLDHNGKWVSLRNDSSLGDSFVAIALNEKTANRLVAPNLQEPRVERYRLTWTPRSKSGSKGSPAGS